MSDAPPTFAEARRVWWQVGLTGFGGPAGQIALLHRLVVEERGWLDERAFLRGLEFCMLLPGPEAQQLATWIGWRLHGVPGALTAGTLFVLPGALLIVALAAGYAAFGGSPLVAAAFLGVKAAVIALVLEAVLRVGRRALHGPAAWVLAASALLAIGALGVPFPLVVLGAGLAGAALSDALRARAGPADPPRPSQPAPSPARVLAIGLTLWLAPLFALGALLGPDHRLVEVGGFLGALPVVTFGGAYTVLAWVAQAAVATFGWLTPGEMLDGLGLAETTPGPLILVLEFVGYLAAYRAPAPFEPWLAGTLGALLAVWVTFVPCFIWVLLGAAQVERIAARPRLAGALAGITAAAAGVIAHLGLWSALATLFAARTPLEWGPFAFQAPVPASLDAGAAALTLLALVLTFGLRWNVLAMLGACGAAGVALLALG
jgi:chromate transporter